MNAGAFGTALGVVGIALSAVVFAVKSYQKAQEDARQATSDAIEETKTDITNLDQLRDRYESIIDSTADEATKDKELAKFKQDLIEVYGFEKDAVEKVNKERQTGLDLLDKEAEASLRRTLSENQSTFETAKRHYQGERSIVNAVDASGISGSMADITAAGGTFADGGDGFTYLTVKGENLRQTYENLAKVIEVLEKKQLSRNGITEDEETLLDSLRMQYYELGDELDKWGTIYEGQIDLMARYNLMVAGVTENSAKSKSELAALKETLKETYGSDSEVWAAMERLIDELFPGFEKAVEESTGAVEKETASLRANQKALDENATASERAAAAKKDAEAATHKYIDALITSTGEITAEGKAAFIASSYLADLANAELQARKEAAQANYASLRAELAAVTAQALRAAAALRFMQAGASTGRDGDDILDAKAAMGRQRVLERQLAAIEAEINSIDAASFAVTPYTTGYSSSSGSGSSGGHSGGSHSGGGSSSSSAKDTKLTALQQRVALLKSELSLMQERGDSEEDQIAKIREIMAALYDEQAYLQSIKGDQTTINNLMQEWYSYHNKIEEMMAKEAEDAEKQAQALQDALDAQRALNNALNNRSVRYYNASTGQWEWIANQSDVESAKQNLRDAIQNLPEDQRSPFLYSLYHSPGGGPGGMTVPEFLPGEIASLLIGNSGSNRGGINNYGNTYNFGGLNFNWQQAQNLTLAQFAQLAGGLGIYNNSP